MKLYTIQFFIFLRVPDQGIGFKIVPEIGLKIGVKIEKNEKRKHSILGCLRFSIFHRFFTDFDIDFDIDFGIDFDTDFALRFFHYTDFNADFVQ